jgi:hypothetical protein
MTFEEMKLLPPEEQGALFKKLKGIRHAGKQVNYSALYGVTPAGLNRNTGIPMRTSEKLLKAYWKFNWPIKAVADACTVKVCCGQKWLYNPVSKLWYSLRHEKDRFSTLNQGTGVFCFDTWIKNVLKRRKQLTGQFHDEIILSIKKGHRDDCKKVLLDAMGETNEEINLNVELASDIQFGDTYADIH